MSWLVSLLGRVAGDVWSTIAADWPYLSLSVIAAAAVPVYLGTDRLSGWLSQRRWLAIGAAVLLATATPFCSCGTTAIVLGMLATRTPWAPIVAFMVASPLTSPEELLLSAGLFGWPFALIFFTGSIVLGFAAGAVTDLLERVGWLAGQARMSAGKCGTCPGSGTCCASGTSPGSGMFPGSGTSPGSGHAVDAAPPAGRGSEPAAVRTGIAARLRVADLAHELRGPGRRLAVYFLGYSAIGYLLIELLPTGSLTGLLSGHSPASIALAAALGVPVYITTEASLPMVAALIHGGLGFGPAMAFLVTGAGTSIGAITGAFVIARARVIALVVTLLFAGALVIGGVAGVILG